MSQVLTKDDIDALVGEVFKRIWEGINSGDASGPLEWIARQPTELVRAAILETQPRGWRTIAEVLVEKEPKAGKPLSDDHCAAILAALVAVFVQAKGGIQPQQQSKEG